MSGASSWNRAIAWSPREPRPFCSIAHVTCAGYCRDRSSIASSSTPTRTPGAADRRWNDRIVVEENLVQAWLILSERYVQHAEHPFRVDAATLRRDDDPPDYISFREAAINLLIHQDYGDHGRKASIRFFRDRTLFWNPGDAFATTDELLDPTEKEVRNPAIVAAFRRIGLSEQAGTGMRAIFRGWQRLGHVPPVIDNDKARKSFELRLLRERLLSEEQHLLQAQLGVKLSETESRLFAFACRQGGASLTDAKAVTGQAGPGARKVLSALAVQGTPGAAGRCRSIRPCCTPQGKPRRRAAWSVHE